MPTYKVEQYEIWAQSYTVEAKNEAEAVALVLSGKATADDNGLEYIEVAEDIGLPVDQTDLSVRDFGAAGVSVESDGDYIPSIRSVEEQ